jgi:hypothetical protein
MKANAPQKYFEVTVAGQYHALHDASGTPTLKHYQESFVVPSQEAALSNVVKFLLAARLKQKYPDFIRFRTHQLVSITLHEYTPKAEVLQMGIDEMTMPQLSDFCILRQLMFDPYKHPGKDLNQLREMVQARWSDKRASVKDSRESIHAAENAEAETLRKLNALPPIQTDLEINVNEQRATQKATARAEAQESTVHEPIESDEPLPPIEPDPVIE